MSNRTAEWEQIYQQVPLVDAPRIYAGIDQSPYMQQYLGAVLRHCPRSGSALETGFGSGHGSIWLSKRGVSASAIDLSPALVERARQVNATLGGSAVFTQGDLFDLYAKASEGVPRFNVIHHQGVLEHFTRPFIRAALAQQVLSAQYVIFSVPSVYYPFQPEMGDERLLPLEEWRELLVDFDVVDLCLHGDPQHGEKEHVLAVLRGQEPTPALLALLKVPEEPYPEGISAVVHTRNEAKRLSECLASLREWTDEIIVCDMESTDGTAELAASLGATVLHHPHLLNFDRARNVSALRANFRWIFYLDADERVPQALGQALRQWTLEEAKKPAEERHSGLLPPFRHHFLNRWLTSLHPGYTSPRLFRNGCFVFNERLHTGAQVDGALHYFECTSPEMALLHLSYDSINHYLDKMANYTDGEALNMHRDGRKFSWSDAVNDMMQDLFYYYDQKGAARDGAHGFVYALLGAVYRLVQHAKLLDLRAQSGRLTAEEDQVPRELQELLQHMMHRLQLLHQPPAARATPLHIVKVPVVQPKSLVWTGPLLSPSGYGEQSRHHFFGLFDTQPVDKGLNLAAQVVPWDEAPVELSTHEESTLAKAAKQEIAPGFIHLVHDFAPGFRRHPEAEVCIGRTVFETDRLPPGWADACNRMDYIWVPTEFNRQTFSSAGVEAAKLRVFPESLNPDDYQVPIASPYMESLRASANSAAPYVFLSIFDWSLHKGWDCLLQSFLRAFEGREDVHLVLKVWSSRFLSDQQIREEAAQWAQSAMGHDLLADARIHFLQQRLTREEVRGLCWNCDAFVLGTRGEGWGRPPMEAMACGKPVISTDWGGTTAFMNATNSYPVRAGLEPVTEAGWREIPTYKGHQWAKPDRDHFTETLLRVESERGEATQRGALARMQVLERFDRKGVAATMWQEVEKIGEERRSHPLVPALTGLLQAAAASTDSPAEVTLTVSQASAQLLLPQRPKLRARWEGEFFAWHSFAHINRELPLRLMQSGQVELSLLPIINANARGDDDARMQLLHQRAFAPLSGPADVHVRHSFPPRLMNKPPEGRFVLILPWEYGYLPEAWVEPINSMVDEVSCMSKYVRQVYESSGVDPAKLHYVPWGINPTVMNPGALPYIFSNEAGYDAKEGFIGEKGKRDRFVFLFVGGTLERKGIDILLEAYQRAFTPLDDVTLVIKDTGTRTVYSQDNQQKRILESLKDSSRPALVYLDDDMQDHALSGLYATCDCYVQPYRGEGFCLPVLEAMACGLPALVPEGGPTDDFVDDEVGWRLPAEHRLYGKQRNGKGSIGIFNCVGPTWAFEVKVDDLARRMRAVVAQRDLAQRKGEAAALRVVQSWSWEHAATRVLERVHALREAGPPVPQPRLSQISVPVADKLLPGQTHGKPPGAEVELIWVPQTASEQKRTRKGGSKGENGDGLRPEPKITLCMIVKNEAKVLGDCLKSVQPWFDEIIVVDTGSTDDTVTVAKSFGCRVFEIPWPDSFAQARNYSLDQATGDWLCWVDADDIMPPECGKRLRELARLADDAVGGFLVQVHIPPGPGQEGFTVVDHVKLFRNRSEFRFTGHIHEQIMQSITKTGGRIETSGVHVVHANYDYSPEGQARKRTRDLFLLELDRNENPQDPFAHFNVGMTFCHMREYDKALPALTTSLELSGPHDSTRRKVYALLCTCLTAQQELAGARVWLERGLEEYPLDPELLFRGGGIYRDCKESALAEQCYLRLLYSSEEGHIDSLDITMKGFKGHHNLGHLYWELGRLQEAERHFQAAVKDRPTFVPAWAALAELERNAGHSDAAEKLDAKVAALQAGESASR